MLPTSRSVLKTGNKPVIGLWNCNSCRFTKTNKNRLLNTYNDDFCLTFSQGRINQKQGENEIESEFSWRLNRATPITHRSRSRCPAVWPCPRSWISSGTGPDSYRPDWAAGRRELSDCCRRDRKDTNLYSENLPNEHEILTQPIAPWWSWVRIILGRSFPVL